MHCPIDNGAPEIIGHPLAAAAAIALAASEMAGDKMKTAPDRIVPIGLLARFITSALAGAALAPMRQRWGGAAALGRLYSGGSLLCRLARPHGLHPSLWPDIERPG